MCFRCVCIIGCKACMYVFGYHWDVEIDLMGGHTNLESMDCGLLRCLCILVVYFCYGCGG